MSFKKERLSTLRAGELFVFYGKEIWYRFLGHDTVGFVYRDLDTQEVFSTSRDLEVERERGEATLG